MDVRLNTIVTRFLFPVAHLSDEEEENCEPTSSGGELALKRSANSRRRPSHISVSTYRPPSPTIEEGLDGSHAYVLAATDAATSTTDDNRNAARSSSSRIGASLDLVRLASCVWNSELQRSAATAAPVACVVRPSPPVFNNVAYRGPSVYVLPSGIVRMVTYGSVSATRRIACRVRNALREAYLPAAVQNAAKEERRLLDAVLGVGIGEQRAATPCEEGYDKPHEEKSGVSLADALSGSSSADKGSTPEAADATDDWLKVDFIQSVATPRWDEVAGLREALFPHASGRPEVSLQADGDDVDHAVLGVGDLRTEQLQPDTPSIAGEVIAPVFPVGRVSPVAVTRASVNVRGDAPLAWWRWFLDSPSAHAGGEPLQPLPKTTASAVNDADVPTSTSTATEVPDATFRFWTCAGHTDIAPASPSAAFFTRFLQLKRSAASRHVVTFKIRRNASQNSLQLLLEWTTSPPPPPSPGMLPTTLLDARGPRVSLRTSLHLPLANKDGRQGQSLPLSTAKEPSWPALATTHDTGEAWVNESSAANVFLESTFIAESTLPYGLESTTRPSVGLEMGASVSTPHGCAALSLPPLSRGSVEEEVRRPPLTVVGGVSTACSLARPVHRILPTTVRRAKRDKPTPGVTEQVSCLIHRTGRVQLSTRSEAAIRQVCDVLLIPFLVATADLALGQ
jgi:hypothetical protein